MVRMIGDILVIPIPASVGEDEEEQYVVTRLACSGCAAALLAVGFIAAILALIWLGSGMGFGPPG